MANQRKEKPHRVWGDLIRDALNEVVSNRRILNKDLAAHLGVSPPTIGRMLSGENSISFDDLAKFAEALGVTRRALLQRAGYIDVDTCELVDISLLTDTAKQSVLVLVGPRKPGHNVSRNGADHKTDGFKPLA